MVARQQPRNGGAAERVACTGGVERGHAGAVDVGAVAALVHGGAARPASDVAQVAGRWWCVVVAEEQRCFVVVAEEQVGQRLRGAHDVCLVAHGFAIGGRNGEAPAGGQCTDERLLQTGIEERHAVRAAG